jgi:hypothetical protein
VKKKSLARIRSNYANIIRLFQESADVETVGDMKARLYGLGYMMKKFDFYFGVSLAIQTLAQTDLLATQLQRKDLSAYEGKELAKKTIVALKALKLEFESFWNDTVAKAEKIDIEEPKLPRQARKPFRFRVPGQTEEISENVKEHYSKIYNEAFENVINCLEERFNQKGLEYYDDLQQLLILAATKQNYEEKLKKILDFYNNERSHDFNEDLLRTQLLSFSANFPTKENVVFDDVIMYFQKMEPSSVKYFSEVGKLVELVLVMPATNSTSERCFSKLRLILTHLRTAMTQKRLNHMMIFTIYKEEVDSLDIEEIAKYFVMRNPVRQRIFGTFKLDQGSLLG